MSQTTRPLATPPRLRRLRIRVCGAVQGVGFRPFVYRLATDLGLTGWVRNSAQGVLIEAEGREQSLAELLRRIEDETPPRASIQSVEAIFQDALGYTTFEVCDSDRSGPKTALVLPDIAVCGDCLREIFDPADRRYRYPFTNCTNCGPRFSLIEALPYDRANTTMRRFRMCSECRAEYENPRDRRFHAQPNACPRCGPKLELWDRSGQTLAADEAALSAAADAIRHGEIVAVKGLGGFHLMVDARNEEAVRRLRQRKQRAEKPLALMFPSLGLVRETCVVSELEERLLRSPESPIVLLKRLACDSVKTGEIAASVAPGNPYLGVMLPYTPLHHLLLGELGFPLVATSGNLADEPICTDEREALGRLGDIADIFLAHNRPIARPLDDSVVRVVLGRAQVWRRARGYAPWPVATAMPILPTLATGGQLKNTVALAAGAAVIVSQHIGDLETAQADDAFKDAMASLTKLYDAKPALLACDEHPDYRSTQFALESGMPTVRVQHHYAHVLACMAEHELTGSVLGVAWDGTGYGLDGTIWGGEFLRVDETSFQRVAHLRTFRLPGGSRAVKEPRRAALGLLYEIFGAALFALTDLAPVNAFTRAEAEMLRTMLEKGINAPVTSSAGRLFDAIASLTGLRQQSNFEGQAAMELEFAADGISTAEAYSFRLSAPPGPDESSPLMVDWEPLVREALADVRAGVSVGQIAAKFHRTLAEMIVAVACRAGEERVVLSGGCYQNKLLTEHSYDRLTAAGFCVYFHQRIPPNDGGIALGQIIAAARQRSQE